MTSIAHERSIRAARHIIGTASLIAGLLTLDPQPDEAALSSIETWVVEIEREADELRVDVQGLRHEQQLRRSGMR